MRFFSTATAAHALGIDRKALDNLLTRQAKHLARFGRRGKSRHISFSVLSLIALALLLNRDLGISLERSLELAASITESPMGEIAVGTLGTIRYDHMRLRGQLDVALAVAMEEVAPPRRGRPPMISAQTSPA